MIKAIPSNNKNEFYENKDVNELVILALDNLDNEDVFLNIMTLLTSRSLKKIKDLNDLFKSKCHDNSLLYDDILELFEKIYEDQNIYDNLRGTFLELVTHNFLKEKYDTPYNHFESALDCHVAIDDKICKKTVDVFALCNQKGFISECKISHKYFEKDDIAALNKLYHDSFNILTPYIVTLAPQRFIEQKLYQLAKEDSTNVYVNLQDIRIVSIDNISNFFS